jgi:hypothetical protein
MAFDPSLGVRESVGKEKQCKNASLAEVYGPFTDEELVAEAL